MNSILYIAGGDDSPNRQSRIAALQRAGLLPVRVKDTATAIRLLREFSVAAVVLHNYTSRDALRSEFARLSATGTPVILLVRGMSLEAAQEHLADGAAAIVEESFAAVDFAAIVRSVSAGKRGVVKLTKGGSAVA